MLKKCKSTIFLILMCITLSVAQAPGNRFSFSGYEIVVDVLPGNDIYYSHRYDKGITIYSLAEIFQVSTDQLLSLNKIHPSQPINDGKIVKIPLQKKWLTTTLGKNNATNSYLPVYYVVKKGDTFYRICKEYFQTDMATLMSLNKKSGKDIQLGEKLLIGWWMTKDKLMKNELPVKSKTEISPVNNTVTEVKTSDHIQESIFNSKGNEDEIKVIKYYVSDVIGRWDKSTDPSASFFVLHNMAKPGTMIDIYNPMLKTHVKAKVLGKIPEGTYREEVELLISASVAKELGILDARFKVNIKYEQ